MSFPCPHCGGEIVVVPGSSPFPGWRNPAQIPAQSGSNPGIAHGFESQDLKPSPKKNQTYNQGYNAQFLDFWQAVPLKRGKRKAQKAWLNAVKRLAQNDGQNTAQAQAQILAGMVRYRDDPNRRDEFTKYAEGWLNGDGWEDEPLPARLDHGRKSTIQSFLNEEGVTDG
jgi:hypothetical protein